ncbi:MAG: mechanosensitive ion channel family protein [Bacteroidota bacterium]
MDSNLFNIGIFVGIIIVTILLAFLINRFFLRLIRRSTQEMSTDPTNYVFLRHAVTALVYIFGFSVAIYTMPNLRALASSLLAGAGILAVAVGFASQHALSNIISGVFIVIFKPFRVNDHLQVRQLNGIVEDITLRHTVIRDFENKRILIPNAIISDEVIINADFVEDKICKWIDINISYDSDIDKARAIIQEEVEQHPLLIDARTEEQISDGLPKVIVRVITLGEYAISLRAWAWAKDSADGFVLSCDLYESIKKRFDKEGVEIPFPHRTLVQKQFPVPQVQ